MKILSIDTSSTLCSVAILENETLLNIINVESENSHSNNLLTVVDDVLKLCSLTIKDVELLTINIGPRIFYWY